MSKRIFTKEWKENLSKAGKGRIFTEEHKKNLSKNSPRLSDKDHPMFNRKHTEESKEKMSNSHKGKDRTEEHKRNLSISNKGQIPWNKGKTNVYSKETLKKMSKNHADVSGENHPNWKGSIACEPYCDVWLDKEYKESIKERDNYTCQNPFCLCDNYKLVVHHINYIKKDCVLNNLITICHSSNSKANKDRWFWQEIYEGIIKK